MFLPPILCMVLTGYGYGELTNYKAPNATTDVILKFRQISYFFLFSYQYLYDTG